MILSESLRLAFTNLWSHKVRSVLTILGVIIGIGSVLAVVTLGASFEESVVSQFDDIDQKTIYVYSTVGSQGPGPPDCGQFCNIFTGVDRQNLEALAGVERVVVEAQVPATNLRWQGRELTYERLTATIPEADEVRISEDYTSGGPFTLGASQIVVGSQISKLLSNGGTIAAGDTVTIRFPDGREIDTTVAGVLKEDTGLFGDRNGRVFVPVDPFYNTTRTSPTTGEETRVYAGFTVVATSVRNVGDLRDQVKSYLDLQSDARLLKVENQNLGADTASDIQSAISNVFGQVTLFIGAIGAVSLLVGAIGIANIMLVSVTERTREIGVMKAIGAKDSEILVLFLLEAVIIGLVGATIGIALGIGGGAAIVSGVFGDDDVGVVVPYNWLAYSVLVGIGVGVVAGYLPARRATKIQPVAALSYE